MGAENSCGARAGGMLGAMRCARGSFGASDPMPCGLKPWFLSASDMLCASIIRARDDASLIRNSYSASAHRTASNTRPVRT
eukprot:8479979-Alexandrium_andersonii.AAC.1